MARMVCVTDFYWVMVVKYKGKCGLGSTAIRMADSIGIYQQEFGCGFELVGYILG